MDWKWTETGFQNSLRTFIVGNFDSAQISLKKESLRKRKKGIRETAFWTFGTGAPEPERARLPEGSVVGPSHESLTVAESEEDGVTTENVHRTPCRTHFAHAHSLSGSVVR